MDQSNLVAVMTAAVIVSAIALVIQAGLLFGMFRAIKSMQERLTAILPKVENLLESSRVTVEESRAAVAEIRTKSNILLDSAQRQVAQMESLLSDVSARTRVQMDHAEVVVEETLTRIDETMALVQRGVLKPIRGITGIVAGVQAAVGFLLRGNRPSPDQATVDEEMFI